MENQQIWVDKYRPRSFNEIIGQEAFISRIQAFIKSKSLPHLLFSGVPGTGKTTTAHVIARELYGEDGIKGNFLELNASDDRGIDVIRNQIKEFAKLKSLTDIPYKIICLDEADSLTKEAQQALRRTMEKYSASCRFILACNEISKIIDPIQSRCVIFKFKPLEQETIKTLLKRIEADQNITVEDDAKEFLIEISRGDVRKVTNSLQAASAITTTITKSILEEVVDEINPKEIEKLLDLSTQGDFFKARDELIKLKTIKGLSGLEILKELYNQILQSSLLDESTKIKVVDKIATVEFRLVEGADQEIQLESIIAFLAMIKQ